MELFVEPETNSVPKDRPFFSIIITTFNRAHIIEKALDSLISQTEHDWEAIIVDDESTDDTYLHVFPYLRYQNKIKYFRKAHSGEALSKNAGIKLAKGRFISFLDSDDEYNSLHLQSRKAILIQFPLVRFLYGGVKIIGNQYVPDRFDYSKKINLSDCVVGGTFFIERNVLSQLNGFRIIPLGTDADLFERAVNAGVMMKYSDIQSYIYHHETDDSITNMQMRSNSDREEQYAKLNP